MVANVFMLLSRLAIATKRNDTEHQRTDGAKDESRSVCEWNWTIALNMICMHERIKKSIGEKVHKRRKAVQLNINNM